MRRGPDRRAPTLEISRSQDSTTRPPPACLQLGNLLRYHQYTILGTLLRRIGLGFTPQPHDKLGKEENNDGEIEMEDLDVGPVGNYCWT